MEDSLRSLFRLRQDVNEWDETRTSGDMLLAGLQLDDFFDNSTECWDKMMNMTYIMIPLYQANLSAETSGVESKVLDTAYVISNVSENLLYCTNFGKSIYEYI